MHLFLWEAAGIFCIIYYIVICRFLKRWNSKFPRFWLVCGSVICLFEWKKGILPGEVLRGIRIAEGLVLLLFLIIEVLILSGMRSRRSEEECDYLIVLGAKVDRYHLTDALRQRLDRACEYLREHPNTSVIVSGGRGKGECVTEGYAMAEYLKGCGIEEGRIWKEEQSTTTRENLMLSGEILLREEKASDLKEISVGIVTNNFHIYRAVRIAQRIGYRKIQAFPSRTTPIMLVNYMVREFFGVLKMWIQFTGK